MAKTEENWVDLFSSVPVEVMRDALLSGIRKQIRDIEAALEFRRTCGPLLEKWEQRKREEARTAEGFRLRVERQNREEEERNAEAHRQRMRLVKDEPVSIWQRIKRWCA